MKIYSCETHINRALDEYVAKEETFPQMERLNNDDNLSTSCQYCKENATYVVTNV